MNINDLKSASHDEGEDTVSHHQSQPVSVGSHFEISLKKDDTARQYCFLSLGFSRKDIDTPWSLH